MIKNRVVAVALIALLAGCSPANEAVVTNDVGSYVATVDGPIFASVEELAAESDMIVQGQFGNLVGEAFETELDGHGTKEGIPFQLWEFRVDKVVSGNALAGTIIRVAEPTENVDGGIATATSGRQSILFLRAFFGGNDTYSITGLGQGSLEVKSGGALVAPSEAGVQLKNDVDGRTAAGLQKQNLRTR